MIGEETRAAFLAEVGLRVRVARTGRRLSQDRLAELADMSRVTLGSVELGKHETGMTTLRALAMALDVPLSMLVDSDDGALARLVATSTRRGLRRGPSRWRGCPRSCRSFGRLVPVKPGACATAQPMPRS